MPEVYMTYSRPDEVVRDTGFSSCTSVNKVSFTKIIVNCKSAIGNEASSVSINLARLFSSMKPMRSLGRLGSIGRIAAPDLRMARMLTTNAMERFIMTATGISGCTPCSISI
ncbi:hypothetical protein D3C80_1442430 [compost metagenome]